MHSTRELALSMQLTRRSATSSLAVIATFAFAFLVALTHQPLQANAQLCSTYTDCNSCASGPCYWCNNGSPSSSGSCVSLSSSCNPLGYNWYVSNAAYCYSTPTCSYHTGCNTCTSDSSCDWCTSNGGYCDGWNSGSSASCADSVYFASSECPVDVNVGAIVGGIIGGLAFICCIVVIVMLFARRRRLAAQSVVIVSPSQPQPSMGYAQPYQAPVYQAAPAYQQPYQQPYQQYQQPAMGYVAQPPPGAAPVYGNNNYQRM
jgi:hypothetical protein